MKEGRGVETFQDNVLQEFKERGDKANGAEGKSFGFFNKNGSRSEGGKYT